MIPRRIAVCPGLALLLIACGGGSADPAVPGGGNNNPPAATTATLSIQMNKTGGTMWPGTVYGRDSTVALTRKDMTSQYGRCSGLEPGNKTCTYLVKVVFTRRREGREERRA